MVTKTASLSKNQASAFLHDVFKHFEGWIQQPKDPTLSELEKFFSSDFQLFSNGLLVSKNLSDHLNRIAKLRKAYARIEVESSFDELLVSDHKLAIYYSLHLTSHERKKSQIDLIAIATLEDNKIKQWIQISHERHKDWLT